MIRKGTANTLEAVLRLRHDFLVAKLEKLDKLELGFALLTTN